MFLYADTLISRFGVPFQYAHGSHGRHRACFLRTGERLPAAGRSPAIDAFTRRTASILRSTCHRTGPNADVVCATSSDVIADCRGSSSLITGRTFAARTSAPLRRADASTSATDRPVARGTVPWMEHRPRHFRLRSQPRGQHQNPERSPQNHRPKFLPSRLAREWSLAYLYYGLGTGPSTTTTRLSRRTRLEPARSIPAHRTHRGCAPIAS